MGKQIQHTFRIPVAQQPGTARGPCGYALSQAQNQFLPPDQHIGRLQHDNKRHLLQEVPYLIYQQSGAGLKGEYAHIGILAGILEHRDVPQLLQTGQVVQAIAQPLRQLVKHLAVLRQDQPFFLLEQREKHQKENTSVYVLVERGRIKSAISLQQLNRHVHTVRLTPLFQILIQKNGFWILCFLITGNVLLIFIVHAHPTVPVVGDDWNPFFLCVQLIVGEQLH